MTKTHTILRTITPSKVAPQTAMIRPLDSSLRSAEDLISDLLDISRLENGRITPDRNPFPLATLFDTLTTEFTVLAAEQGVDFRVHGSRLRVDSDIRLLRRVLQAWSQGATALLTARLENAHEDPVQRLRDVVSLPFRGRAAQKAARIELAIRAWARRDPMA